MQSLQNQTQPPHPPPAPAATHQAAVLEAALAPLLQLFAEALAPLLAAELAKRQPEAAAPERRRLLSLDELLPLLPAGKKPETWKAWLYQRTRLGQVPGCHKIGGRLFFDFEITVAWLENAATGAPQPSRLDVSGQQSNHADPVPTQPHTPRHNPQERPR